METQTKTGGGAKDFFINLGAIVALYTIVGSLINLLFTVINKAYPQINSGYNYYGESGSISWQVATLIIFTPIFILLMWLLAREYTADPEKKNRGIHKWLTYITLFFAGLTIAIDLIMVLYYFIDGQELTTGFLLKIISVLGVAVCIFVYYISDIRDKLTSKSRIIWRIIAGVIIVGAIVAGFSVLGSPHTQRLYKYDQEKINSLSTINNLVENYYSDKGTLPTTINDLNEITYGMSNFVDPQTQKPLEYEKIDERTYNLCAEFNKASDDNMVKISPYAITDSYGVASWEHPAGRHCFKQTINPNLYLKPIPIR